MCLQGKNRTEGGSVDSLKKTPLVSIQNSNKHTGYATNNENKVIITLQSNFRINWHSR